jgi:parallel beta-helix repeat protein
VLVFPLLLNNNNIRSNTEVDTNSIHLKSSGGYNVPFIHIDGSIAYNWTDTLAEPWCYNENGIYVIENVTIDATGSQRGYGILINNSINVRFVIRNCTIINARHSFFDSGIKLENTNNGTIINNNCSENYEGIYLTNAIGNNITENIVNNNNVNGIYIDGDCHENNITRNTVTSNLHFGIQLVGDCDHNNITLNTVTKNGEYGIYINSFGTGVSCDNNIVLNNSVKENDKYGIYFNVDNYDNAIINNTASENKVYGLRLLNCHDMNVYGNLVRNNRGGMYLQQCDNCNITHNIVNNNDEIGIYLFYNSDGNQIKYNTINQNDLGIYLEQSDFNNITENTLLDNNWCIFEINCEGNLIENNDCSAPLINAPIYIDGIATGVGAHNWTWVEQQSWFGGGLGTEQFPYIIENLVISGFGITDLNCIEVINSNVYFTIQGCETYNAGSGISLQRVNNSLLINNNCSNNRNGIYLEDECYNNEITENTCNDNDQGISLYLMCSHNDIIDNILNRNGDGIALEDDCNSTLISGNSIYNNSGPGMYFHQSGYNTITENIASGNENDGIFLEEGCDHNVILQNTFDYNNIGIDLYYSDHNSITENTASFNIYDGIEIEAGNYNSIIGNTIANNTEFGIYIETDSNRNSIYRNYFLNNGMHAYDDGVNNEWNSTTIGNYWDNHTGPDSNHDGIVDTPYTYIGGSAGSIDYLPIAIRIPNGLDPMVIAIIIVVSVIGGIAIVVVILIMLKKQGKISLEKLKRFSFKKD